MMLIDTKEMLIDAKLNKDAKMMQNIDANS